MSQFSWESEDEQWEANELASQGPEPRRPRRLWLIVWLVVSVVAGGVSLASYWRITDISQQLSEEVLASYMLTQSAIELDDQELYRSVLAQKNEGWADAKTNVFELQIPADRAAVGLELQPVASSSRPADVRLNPDLTSAELIHYRSYVDPAGREIELKQVDIYRWDTDRWLLSPHSEAFWGEWRQLISDSGRVIIIAPERDVALAQELLSELDRLIEDLCRLESFAACVSTQPFRVRLVKDPDAIAELHDPLQVMTVPKDEVTVPTPTLFGEPTDSVGQQVWLDVYGRHLLPGILVQFQYYKCCETRAHIYVASSDHVAAELGLTTFREPLHDYAKYTEQPFQFSEQSLAQPLDPLDDVRGWRAAVMVDFVLAETDLTPLELQGRLREATDEFWWDFVWQDEASPEERTVRLVNYLEQQDEISP